MKKNKSPDLHFLEDKSEDCSTDSTNDTNLSLGSTVGLGSAGTGCRVGRRARARGCGLGLGGAAGTASVGT